MWYWIVISSLASGLLGVVISIHYQHLSEVRRIKFQVFQQLIGNRNELKGQKFTEAMNQIPLVFSGCNEILNALKVFNEEAIGKHKSGVDVSNQKLLDLFVAISKHLKINKGPLTDNYFLTAFNIRS